MTRSARPAARAPSAGGGVRGARGRRDDAARGAPGRPDSPPAPATATRYRIQPSNPAAHLFSVSVTVDDPDPAGQQFMMAAWIPGSYMIREFARNVVTLDAEAGGLPVSVAKTDKATWRCAPCDGPLTVRYEVYAWDLSVRAAHLDESHGFFNGTSVFLLPLGRESAPCEVEIAPPDGSRYAGWKIATSMKQSQAPARLPGQKSPRSRANAGSASPDAAGPKPFGRFSAANFDELIDQPVEMGTFAHAVFEACGVPHHVAITGQQKCDLPRLCADLKKICEYQIRLFEPATAKAPMDEYWFLVMAVGDGYGGLEHRASTALICSRDDLPSPLAAGERKIGNGYRRFLGLASHEYFHAWNVKRIRPAAFDRYDLAGENYTRQLWFFEGFTSYYDDLVLARTGLIDQLAYLEIVAENIGRVQSQSGRRKQSVADSSFDAWVKYYRQDENAPNAIVSYYQKGSLVALALDLTIRQLSGGQKSLDDVMRRLWTRHGKPGRGVPEDGVEEAVADETGLELSAFFDHAVRGTGDLDLGALLAHVSIELGWKIPGARPGEPVPPSLGAKVGADANGDARLQQVFDGGSAQAAGLSAGDVVIAVDGLRVSALSLDRRLRTHAPGTTVEVTAFRRDELMTFRVALQPQAPQTCVLTMAEVPIGGKGRRNAWLMG